MADRRKRKLPRPRPRLQRGLSILPSLFTVGNIFCGYYAVIATLRGNYDHAAVAIGLGALLDGLDGRIARLTKTSSEFGVQFDSIADFGTFGIAPAMLAFSWGLGFVDVAEQAASQHLRSLGWLATFAFVICGGLRLARFNIQTQKPAETSSKRYFVGLPIPIAAILVASIIHFFEFFRVPAQLAGAPVAWGFFSIVLVTAFLMISRIRYHSFKELDVMKRGVRVFLFGSAMMIGLIIFYSQVVVLIMGVVYVASGPSAKIAQLVRRLFPSSHTQGEPVHGNIKT